MYYRPGVGTGAPPTGTYYPVATRPEGAGYPPVVSTASTYSGRYDSTVYPSGYATSNYSSYPPSAPTSTYPSGYSRPPTAPTPYIAPPGYPHPPTTPSSYAAPPGYPRPAATPAPYTAPPGYSHPATTPTSYTAPSGYPPPPTAPTPYTAPPGYPRPAATPSSYTAPPPGYPHPGTTPSSYTAPPPGYPHPGTAAYPPQGPSSPLSKAGELLLARELGKPIPVIEKAIPNTPSHPIEQNKKTKKEKKEYYDLEWENNLIKRVNEREIIDHLFTVTESSILAKNPAYFAISNQRLILIAEDLKSGVYWPLKTTRFSRIETSKAFGKWSCLYFQSTIPNATERFIRFDEKKDAAIAEALFKANIAYNEFNTVYIVNRNNNLAVFNEECATVIRFSDALSQCSHNITALFLWLITADYVLPLVRKQLRAVANEWTKSTIGNTSMDDFQMLDVIEAGSDKEQYLIQVSKQIAQFFAKSSLMKQYCGAIPLLDAYYYYGKATAQDLRSPDEFLQACMLLTEENSNVNHVYYTVIKGKQVLCGESITYEKAETLILDKIDQAKGCYARSLIIREMGIPIGICEDILNKMEKNKKIVRDNASGDVFYFRNYFVKTPTKTIVYLCLLNKHGIHS